jgi:phenylpyruvate tautomerase PptA (4-oxalocrotonate tautomerase family)
MPLVRIDLLNGRSPEERAAIGAAVHQAMSETIDVPPDDVFQVITEHDQAGLRYDPGYLGIARDDGVVFIHMTMRSGRTADQKRALYARVVELLSERAGVRPGNVLIVLAENELIDWSFGEGIAQIV